MKKLIDKDPFSNGSEHLLFESNNCDLCIKSSQPTDDGKRFTNADKDNMPKCSIQRDIVTRMFSNDPIKQETIDICNNYILHGTPCPYMQTQWKHRQKHRQKQAKNQQSLEI